MNEPFENPDSPFEFVLVDLFNQCYSSPYRLDPGYAAYCNSLSWMKRYRLEWIPIDKIHEVRELWSPSPARLPYPND